MALAAAAAAAVALAAAAAAAVSAAAAAAASAAVVASFSFFPLSSSLAPFVSILPSTWSLGLCVVLLFGFVMIV